MSTIYILWRRQITRYLRSKSRILGSLGQPVLFLVALGFGFGPIFQKAGGGNYIDFIAPGIIAMSILFTSIFSGMEIIWDKQFGFLKETLVAPVSRFKIMLGRTLGGATVAVMQGVLVFCISLLAGFRPESWAMVPMAFVFMILTAILFTALGTAIASLIDDMQGFQFIMSFLVMPVFFLSGALFPLSGLPKIIAVISSLNPLSYGVDGLRSTLSTYSHFGVSLDFFILFVSASVLIGVGGYLFSKIQV